MTASVTVDTLFIRRTAARQRAELPRKLLFASRFSCVQPTNCSAHSTALLLPPLEARSNPDPNRAGAGRSHSAAIRETTPPKVTTSDFTLTHPELRSFITFLPPTVDPQVSPLPVLSTPLPYVTGKVTAERRKKTGIPRILPEQLDNFEGGPLENNLHSTVPASVLDC